MTATKTAAVSAKPPRFSSFITQKQPLKVRINPLVEVTILEAYLRRPKKENRAIGTLLGYVSEGSVLEVTDCFQVLHTDSAERGVFLDKGCHARCVALRQQICPKESVIGWFSISGESKAVLGENTVSVHNFFRQKESSFRPQAQMGFNSPIYLQFDCGSGLQMKCFSSDFIPGSAQNLLQFYELPVLKAMGVETKILKTLRDASQDQFVAKGSQFGRESEPVDVENIDGFKRNLLELKDLFVSAKTYVDKVISGELQPNVAVGRGLLKDLRSIERALATGVMDEDTPMDVEGAEQDTSVQVQTVKDATMVRYLSTICKTQVAIAEKVQAVLSLAATEQ